MKILAAIAALFISTAANAEWTVEQMNAQINQTNFIVNDGCSGTLLDAKKRLILTNYHCVDFLISSVEREVTGPDGTVQKKKFRKYEDVRLEQNTYDGFTRTGSATYVGEIVAEAKTRDLAVVRVKGAIPHTFAAPIRPATDPVLRGERVYIVGNPLGNDGSLVEGIVSNVNRAFDLPWTDGARLPLIQMSGGIAGGNSGGALYDSAGRFIGVPAVGYRGTGHLGFAIPLDVIRPFLNENCLMTEDDEKCRADREAKKKEKKD